MVERVKAWISEGEDVRIFTTRVWPVGTFEFDSRDERSIGAADQHARIWAWCLEHIGRVLPVSCIKDFQMIELWDDRAVQEIPNTGQSIDEALREEKGSGEGTAGSVS
jgi:hypothetical protein